TTLVGRYSRDELSRLLSHIDWVVVPSVWWENSPLVIQDAFLHERPVICSNIGGMAEKVIDGVKWTPFPRRRSARPRRDHLSGGHDRRSLEETRCRNPEINRVENTWTNYPGFT